MGRSVTIRQTQLHKTDDTLLGEILGGTLRLISTTQLIKLTLPINNSQLLKITIRYHQVKSSTRYSQIYNLILITQFHELKTLNSKSSTRYFQPDTINSIPKTQKHLLDTLNS